MSNSAINVLLVEDSQDDAFFIRRELEQVESIAETVHIETAHHLHRALESERTFDIVLTDYNLGNWSGLDVLEEVLAFDPLLPVILVSGRVGEERAVEVIRKGARDYVSKDDLRRLNDVVQREVRNARTERRELEMAEKLQESEARFAQVFRVSPDPMVISDSFAEYIRDANEAFCELTGFSSYELIGRRITELELWIEPDEVERARELIASEGMLKSRELKLRGVDGEERTILWTAEGGSAFDTVGIEPAILWLGKDITRTLQMEKNLRDSERLRALGTLSGGIAHDFNNILMVMMGYTEMAQAKSQDKRITRYLGEIYQAVERAQELIRQILAFSRGDEGERSEILLAPVVKEVLRLIRPSIPSSIKIEADISSELYVYGDPSHIHQIVMNLCTNSYHAMKDSPGTLSVRLHDKDFEGGKYVLLEVEDSGSGIEEKTLTHIFEPFYTTKAVGEGTGLGLSVVHGLVSSYGGTLELSSSLGEGTLVRIYLPATSNRGSHASDAASYPDEFRGSGKVLVVDDEVKVADVISLMVEDLGYQVSVAHSAEEALKEFMRAAEAGGRYDGVVTDLTMPGMSGEQLAEEVKVLSPETTVLLCSGYYELNTEKERADHVDDYLSKPIKKRALARKLHTHIEEKRKR